MLAMTLHAAGGRLRPTETPIPFPGENDIVIKVAACGVCRTDLHIVDGELPLHKTPVVPGHEIVGTVVSTGEMATEFALGERVGVPWLGGTCGRCRFCVEGRENLCDEAVFTGYDRDGGYAEYAIADARYCLPIPSRYDDAHAAPLLCAGLIGYRAYSMTGNARRLGLYGFGAAAHIVAQLATQQGREVFAFTRPGDMDAQRFAVSLGAIWAGDSFQKPPCLLDAAIIFAPDGALVPVALASIAKGGSVVCAGIHMQDIPRFPYALLWGERQLRSVANLTLADGREFFALASRLNIATSPVGFALRDANQALDALRSGRIVGAAVLLP